MKSFDEFFREATGRPPYGYQARLAGGGLPAVVQAPTGCGKTGIVLAWLWRRLHGEDPAATPRRLIYALPQRSLVEQVAGEVSGWLSRLPEAKDVALHVVMGGAGESQRQWRLDMHRPAIVVGTVDSLVSKALNRGYGIGRASYPIDFALVTNGAHWVIDEVQLCPESTTTLRQLAGFAAKLGTAEPFGLTCMSATVPKMLLGTIDNPAPGPADVLTIEPAERTGELAVRLGAQRTIRRLAAEPGDYQAIADEAVQRHRPGSLTLVVLNTVEAARKVHAALSDGPAERTLLHSRFRGHERQELVRRVTGPPGGTGHIVVATQVVEAGLDLNAAVLITEAAPWPCIVQRAGRCNRTGMIDGAELIWIRPADHPPYPEPDIAATVAELETLGGAAVTGETLLERSVPTTDVPVAVLRRPDLVGLFDTAPDLSGADIDIAPYVRDTDDLDVQLAWAVWESARPDGAPPADAKAPTAEWRCRVPLKGVAALLKRDIPVWRLDQAVGRWARVTRQQRARPGEVLLVAAADGGYNRVSGFDSAVRGPVPDSPVLDAPVSPALDRPEQDVATGTEEAFGADSASLARQDWMTLQQHSDETRDHARALLAALRPNLPAGAAQTVVTAAYLHDAGKAHKIWQDALCALATSERKAEIEANGPWAKSDGSGRLRFAKDVPFRHELASLLLLDGPLRPLLTEARANAEVGARTDADAPTDPDADLARYLVLAHHGRLRIQVRDPGEASEGSLLGLEQGTIWSVPELFGQPAAELTVDVEQFGLGGNGPGPAWRWRCATGTGRSCWPTWKPSSGSPTGARAPGWTWRDDPPRTRRTPTRAAELLPGRARPDPAARRAGRSRGQRGMDSGRPGHRDDRGRPRDMARSRVRSHPRAQPLERRQRLRRKGQGAKTEDRPTPGQHLTSAGGNARGYRRGGSCSQQGPRRGLDRRRR
jgi:CRISPR-associated endonuclease/helicase Cas3